MTQALLEQIRSLPQIEHDAVLERFGHARAGALESYHAITFIDMAEHMALADAARDVVGPERNVELWHGVILQTLERPLLAGFVTMSLKLFGLTPAGLLSQSARVLHQLIRDAGSVEYEPRADRSGCEIVLHDFPADRFRFDTFIEGTHGAILGALTVTRHTGTVRVHQQDPGMGLARFVCTWKPEEG